MDLNNLYRDLLVSGDLEVMDRVLDKGAIYSVASDDVYNGGTFSSQPLIGSVEIETRYILASVETFLKYAETVGGGMGSVYASVETYLKYAEAADGDNRENKLFLSSINRLVAGSASMTDRLLDKGIVESSWTRVCKDGIEVFANENEALNGFSFLARAVVDLATDVEDFDRILDKGVVFDLYQTPSGGRAVIASVETYLKYAEAVM
jgi:hypothetical protein